MNCKKNDDDPDPKLTNLPSCKVSRIETDGKLTDLYTYNGNQLIKWREGPDSSISHDYIYQNGKIASIIRSSRAKKDTTFFEYNTDGLVSRIFNPLNGKPDQSLSFKWNQDGTVNSIFSPLTIDKTFDEEYFFNYENGDLKSIVDIQDANGDGILDPKADTVLTSVFVLGKERNPIYGFYLYDDYISSLRGEFFCKHAVMENTIMEGSVLLYKLIYNNTFDSNGNLIRSLWNLSVDPRPTDIKYSYKCD
jgi:hypothetical protein